AEPAFREFVRPPRRTASPAPSRTPGTALRPWRIARPDRRPRPGHQGSRQVGAAWGPGVFWRAPGLLPGAPGPRRAAWHRDNSPQVGHGVQSSRVVGAKLGLTHTESLLEQRDGMIEFAGLPIGEGQVVQTAQGVRVLGTEYGGLLRQ